MRYVTVPAPIRGMLKDPGTGASPDYLFSGYLLEFVYARKDIFRDSNDSVESMRRLVAAFASATAGDVVALESVDFERLRSAACTSDYAPAIVVQVTCEFVYAITSAKDRVE